MKNDIGAINIRLLPNGQPFRIKLNMQLGTPTSQALKATTSLISFKSRAIKNIYI